jgi:hypothetical protein
MTNRKRRILTFAATVLVIAGVGVFALLPQPDRITPENFDRILDGMSLLEVDSVLGPSGDYTTGPITIVVPEWGLGVPAKNTYYEWTSDSDSILIGFDTSGEVVDKEHLLVRRLDGSLFDNLLWRAKRQWRRWFPEK